MATLTGDNGLLQKATTAKQENEKAKELELIKLAVSAAQVAGEGNINEKVLNDELIANLGGTETANKVGENWYYKGYIIEENGNVEKYDKLLPKEYQQVEYIESTGAQYIDTKKVANYNYKIQIDCYIPFSSYTDYGWLFGSRIRIDKSPWSKNGIAICINNQGIRYDFGNITNNSFTYQQDGRKNIIIDNTGGYCNGVKLIDFSNAIFTDSELSGNMLLCALLDTGNYFDVRNKNWYDWKNIFLSNIR